MSKPTNEIILEKFGKFFLLDRIGIGGMAEIFRARPASPEANGRVVVIKRVLPHVSMDPSFLTMFRFETQVCMAFSHPNLVTIHDFGEVEGRPYLAMEYVEGVNLRRLISAAAATGPVPVEMAAGIIEQAASAMHYAHTFENSATGECPRVVHRDLSPQNILVTYDGNVKVIDFGIAKTGEATADTTRVGTIKGKISYLSPEQAKGQKLDARSDVFALGIVLWELLTCKRLFPVPEAGEAALLAWIQNCEGTLHPPSQENPKVTSELDAIVMKALAADREKRYPSSKALADALHEFLSVHHPKYNPSVATGVIRELFSAELAEDRKALHELNRKAQAIVLSTTLDPGPTRVVDTDAALRAVRPWSAETPAPGIATSGQLPTAQATTPGTRGPTVRLTTGRVIGVALYVLTIIFLKLDQKYFFFERLTMPTEYVRYAIEETHPTRTPGWAATPSRLPSAPAKFVKKRNGRH